MGWETALRARLRDDAAVAAIVHSRIAFAVADQNWPMPMLVMTVVADERDSHMGGWNGLCRSTVQFDCYAETRAQAAALREAVIAAISPRAVISGVRFEPVTQVSVRDMGAKTDTGFVHRDSIDAPIWHS